MIDSPDSFDSRCVRLIPCWIALAVLAVFGSLSHCGFTEWDDPSTLARNPDFNPPSVASTFRYWREPHMGLWAPATYTVWSAIAHVAQGELPNGVGSQLKAAPFHTANVLLHIASACVAYRILRLLLNKPWPAAVGAMLFALHPMQVEPVAWVSGLKDVLCGLLVQIAVWQYLRFVRNGQPFTATLATIAFFAALLSKPTAVVTPLIALVLGFGISGSISVRARFTLLGVWCIASAAIALVASRAQTIDAVPTVMVWQRPFIALDALGFYLRRLVWPSGLAVDYSRRPAVVLAGHYVLKATLPIVLAAVLFHQRRRRPWLLRAAAAFVAPLLPVLGLRPFMMQYTSTVADHYLYLPMLGVALAAASALRDAPPKAFGGVSILLVALAVRSSFQTKVWQSDETLNRHTLAVNPESFTSHINLAHDLELKGDFEGELREDAEALRCNPSFPLARGNYAVMLATLGRLAEAEAQCTQLQRLIDPLPAPAKKRFAPTFAFVGRQLMWHGQPAHAGAWLQQALAVDPRCSDAAADLATLEASVKLER